jgi:hypothetical protein
MHRERVVLKQNNKNRKHNISWWHQTPQNPENFKLLISRAEKTKSINEY